MGRNLWNAEPEIHLLLSDRIWLDLGSRVDKCQFFGVGEVVGRPVRIVGRNERVGVARDDDCSGKRRMSDATVKGNPQNDIQDV